MKVNWSLYDTGTHNPNIKSMVEINLLQHPRFRWNHFSKLKKNITK